MAETRRPDDSAQAPVSADGEQAENKAKREQERQHFLHILDLLFYKTRLTAMPVNNANTMTKHQ